MGSSCSMPKEAAPRALLALPRILASITCGTLTCYLRNSCEKRLAEAVIQTGTAEREEHPDKDPAAVTAAYSGE
jgi:L-asparaginase II